MPPDDPTPTPDEIEQERRNRAMLDRLAQRHRYTPPGLGGIQDHCPTRLGINTYRSRR